MTSLSEPSDANANRPKTGLIAGFIWSILVASVLIALSLFDRLPEGPEEWTLDWRTALFSDTPAEQKEDIAVVLVTDDSLAKYPYRSPVDRALLARAVRGLDDAGAKAIGLDFIFDRPTEPAKDDALAEAVKNARTPIIFGAIDRRARDVSEENFAFQDEFFRKGGRPAAHIFFGTDDKTLTISDNVIRRVGEASTQPGFEKSLAEALANTQKPTKPLDPPLIDWLLPPKDGNNDTFLRLQIRSHAPAAADAPSEEVIPPEWRAALKGKFVLLGGEFGDRDRHLTPLSVGGNERMPGVIIHAHILSQILEQRILKQPPPALEAFCLFLISAAGFYAARRWVWMQREWIVYGSGLAVLILAGIILFTQFKVVLPTTTLLLAWLGGVSGGYYCDRALKLAGLAR